MYKRQATKLSRAGSVLNKASKLPGLVKQPPIITTPSLATTALNLAKGWAGTAGAKIRNVFDPAVKPAWKPHPDNPPKPGESAGAISLVAASEALVEQLLGEGIKVSPEKVVAITKTSGGGVVWLEEGVLAGPGVRASGLAHIVESHGGEFALKGISEADIPDVLMRAAKAGTIVGYQGAGKGRPIYEVAVNGRVLRIAMTIGDNGYIVGANISK